MNFIKSLQEEIRELKEKREITQTNLRDVLGFLCSAKFTGTESNGERKDWIATGDVDRMIREIIAQS